MYQHLTRPAHGTRALLAALCLTLAPLLAAPEAASAREGGGAPAAPARYRLTWWGDPATTAALGWEQGGAAAEVRYEERARWLETGALTQRAPATPPRARGGAWWAHLTGLRPATAYQVQVVSADGAGPPLWFETAHDAPRPFRLIAGGDSRNHRAVRRAANRLVALSAPLAVLFGGDFTAQDTRGQWDKWFDDWQLSVGPTGRLTPLVPARGNHDSEETLTRAWGEALGRFYYAFNLGGAQARVYTLNSERPAGGEQQAWLAADLAAHPGARLKVAQYHKPMRPHTDMKVEGYDEYTHWAELFTTHALDLAVECDSHLMKVTAPLRYDPTGPDGFRRAAQGGTTFIGEGGWGAPLRSVSAAYPWTIKSGRINHIFLIDVQESGAYEARAVEVPREEELAAEGAAGDPSEDAGALEGHLKPWRGFVLRRAPNSAQPPAP
ncbi:MAG: metallophosphoesterase family protein [Deltaproteobacteria bacterium]|nr:metallophosphoesterase family protein [Deltaproteobacteria bacterium]